MRVCICFLHDHISFRIQKRAPEQRCKNIGSYVEMETHNKKKKEKTAEKSQQLTRYDHVLFSFFPSLIEI